MVDPRDQQTVTYSTESVILRNGLINCFDLHGVHTHDKKYKGVLLTRVDRELSVLDTAYRRFLAPFFIPR